jgi:hypothetical protein
MIELYNNAGTESYGCFDKLKSAGGVLATLASRGVKSVTVSSFRGRNLVRVYRVLTSEGCRIIKMQPTPTPAA